MHACNPADAPCHHASTRGLLLPLPLPLHLPLPAPVPLPVTLSLTPDPTAPLTLHQARLYCREHEGLFVSQLNEKELHSSSIEQLFIGIPHGVLLQTEEGELSLLVSAAAKPVQPHAEAEAALHRWDAVRASLGASLGSKPSSPRPSSSTPPPLVDFSGTSQRRSSFPEAAGAARAVHAACLLHRSDTVWLAALRQARHYLYPVHPSGALLGSRTLASSLYLLLLYMLHRQHAEALRLLEACMTDTELSQEEGQLWAALGQTASDDHADAHAVRLKIRLLAEGTPAMQCPWDDAHNAASLEAYALRRDVVSAGCRLTPREELELLRLYLPREDAPSHTQGGHGRAYPLRVAELRAYQLSLEALLASREIAEIARQSAHAAAADGSPLSPTSPSAAPPAPSPVAATPPTPPTPPLLSGGSGAPSPLSLLEGALWFDRAVEPFAVLLITADDPTLQRCAPHDLHHSPLTTYHLPPTTYHLPPTTYYSQLTTRCAPHDLQVASHEDDEALNQFLQVLEGLAHP